MIYLYHFNAWNVRNPSKLRAGQLRISQVFFFVFVSKKEDESVNALQMTVKSAHYRRLRS